MKTRFYLLIAMVLLLLLLPAAAAAAPPRPPFISVRLWTLPADELPAIAQLSAWDINWRVPRAATVEIGYVYCEDGLCQTVVEGTYRITKDDKYPQQLDLAGKMYHQLVADNACTLKQFVKIRDKAGALVVAAHSLECNICLDP